MIAPRGPVEVDKALAEELTDRFFGEALVRAVTLAVLNLIPRSNRVVWLPLRKPQERQSLELQAVKVSVRSDVIVRISIVGSG